MRYDRHRELVESRAYAALPLSGQVVLFVLELRMNDDSGEGWPSLDTLQHETGLSRKSVKKGVRELASRGLIEIEDRGAGSPGRPQFVYHRKEIQPGYVVTGLRRNRDTTGQKPGDVVPPNRKGIGKKKSLSAKSDKQPSKVKAWSLWIDCNREAGRADPVKVGPDLGAAKSLGALIGESIPSADDLPRIMAAFLADSDPFLLKQGHPLRLLPGRINAYLNNLEAGQREAEFRAASERYAASGAEDSPEVRQYEARLKAEGKP